MTLPETKIPRKMSFRGFRELGGSRTHNLLGRNQVLYPLSYESFSFERCKGNIISFTWSLPGRIFLNNSYPLLVCWKYLILPPETRKQGVNQEILNNQT